MSSSADDDDDDPRLPHDVFIDILKWLPVKDLLRFRCVCRSWRSTIDDPSFVALHLRHSALDASHWYVACLNVDDRLCSLFSVKSLARPCLSRVKFPFAARPERFCFVGSCDGLVCVTVSRIRFGWLMYLWNLFTRRYKAVLVSGPLSEYTYMNICNVALGFGFDARSNDYKIVRIISRRNLQEPRADVYSLGTNSWRRLECEVPEFSTCSKSSAFFNGNMHWLVYKWSGNVLADESIAFFDVAREVCDLMPLSEEFLSVSQSCKQLCVFNDLLAVSTVNQVPTFRSFSLWVMREYGVPASWTRLYTFKDARPLEFDGITSTGELLMIVDNALRVSWNPITRRFTKFSRSRLYDVVNVVESLVSL